MGVEYGDTKIIFDPQRNNQSYSHVFITHAHLDHSRGLVFSGPQKKSTVETKQIVEAYKKKVTCWNPFPIGGREKIDDLEIVSHNAGHVLGSALYEVITPEGNIVYTGDLQFKDSFTLKMAEPVSCDVLVIESTFGSPRFMFPERDVLAQEMIQWAHKTIKKGKIPTFKTDSLGNAQEITKAFGSYSNLPIIVHWKIAQINEIYKVNGHDLTFVNANSEEAAELFGAGECIFIVPKNVKVFNRPELEPALVSGWAVWSKKFKRAFPLSDHADFFQLMDFVTACKPRVVLTCFGGKSNTIFANQVEAKLRIEARPLDLIPTKFLYEPPTPRIRRCMKEVLKVLRLPGFVYARGWVNSELKPLGFLVDEIEEALTKLTHRGILKASKDSLRRG